MVGRTLLLIAAIVVSACEGAAPSPSASPETSCLPVPPAERAPLPAGSPCATTAFDPPFTIVPDAGWSGSETEGLTLLTLDNGYYTSLTLYRYGGAVVPHYCVDPPTLIPTPTTAGIVAWVQSVKGLEVRATETAIGARHAWRIDIDAVAPEGCGDPGKGVLVPLWTVDGQDQNLPDTMDGGTRQRFYLIEVASTILVVSVHTPQPLPGNEPDPMAPDFDEFAARADALLSTMTFD
jgi:hypothetical protein